MQTSRAPDSSQVYLVGGGTASLASVPSLKHAGHPVNDDIIAFNTRRKTHALARVVDRDGHIVEVTSMGFTEPNQLDFV